MPKTTLLQIPNPCQKPWQQMDPQPGGRYCEHCQHVVQDLSHLSDDALGRLMMSPDAPHCARFRKSQLNRVIQYEPIVVGRSWPRFLLGTMLALAVAPHVLLAKPPHIEAVAGTATAPSPGGGDQVMTLRGTVVNVQTGEPVHSVKVYVTEALAGDLTDENGQFEFEINLDRIKDSVAIVFEHYSLVETLVIKYAKHEIQEHISVAILEEDPGDNDFCVGAVRKTGHDPVSIELITPISKRRAFLSKRHRH